MFLYGSLKHFDSNINILFSPRISYMHENINKTTHIGSSKITTFEVFDPHQRLEVDEVRQELKIEFLKIKSTNKIPTLLES